MRHLAYIIACFVLLINIQLVNAQGDVKIGTQVWTSKNLDVSTFRNGDPIPQAKTEEEWVKASKNKKAAFCYYDFDPKHGEKYGKLYNWYAVSDSRGLAPNGYHIPSDAEWTILTDFLGGSDIAGKKMKSKNGWANDWNGNNSSRFNGLPGGGCYYGGNFSGITGHGRFWSSSEFDTSYAWSRSLYYDSKKVRIMAC